MASNKDNVEDDLKMEDGECCRDEVPCAFCSGLDSRQAAVELRVQVPFRGFGAFASGGALTTDQPVAAGTLCRRRPTERNMQVAVASRRLRLLWQASGQ